MLSFKYDTIGDHPECQYVQGVIPTNGMYKFAYAVDPTPAFSSAAAGTVLNARSIKPETGKARVFLGSATKIEELTSSGITDRSKAGGYNSTAGWSFSQGIAESEIVAANIGYKIQKSTGGAFSEITDAPKALIVLAQSRALLALNYIDDTGTYNNGIKTSDRGSSATWTASSSNDAVAVKLVETPGEIYAGATFSDLVIAWKRQSMYLGRFVGGAEKWQFNLLSPSIGCFGPEAWASTPAGIIFAGPAGVYLFDGSVPREIDQGVRQTILNYIGSENSFGYRVQISHDEYSGCVFIWVPDAVGASVTDNFLCFAYNYREGRWSIPYPIYDKVNNAYYDFGFSSPSDLQAILRDLTVFDYNQITGSNLRYVGHFIVAGDKKVYNLSEYIYSASDPQWAIRVKSGRIKVAAPPDTDLVLRRVYPVWGSGNLFSGVPLATDDVKCIVNAYDFEHYERNGPSSTTTVSYDHERHRFDVFATGKIFDVEIYTGGGGQASLKDIRFDIVPVGKT